MFPYTETPKIAFNYRTPYTTEQMVHIYQLLHKLGGPNGMIRQTEFFVYSEKDRKAIEECLALGYDIPPMMPFVGENFNVTRAGIHALVEQNSELLMLSR